MALSFQTAAYGAVVVAGVVLFSIGTPAERSSQAPVTVTPVSHSAPPPPGVSGNGVALQSVSVEFPSSDRSFPGGAAAEAITDNCTACHSPGMVLNQPALTPAHWQAELSTCGRTSRRRLRTPTFPRLSPIWRLPRVRGEWVRSDPQIASSRSSPAACRSE